MGFERSHRTTRRRSSAGPLPPRRPLRSREPLSNRPRARPTFLTLRDHGKVFVADLPRLSDGQLANVGKEAAEMLQSLEQKLSDFQRQGTLSTLEQETMIRASTKRDVTERFIRAVREEQDQRRSNPALKAAAGESLARAFLEIARHRLPGATFDSLLQEALQACDEEAEAGGEETAATPAEPEEMIQGAADARLPVVLSPYPEESDASPAPSASPQLL
ncbi:histidine phosphotransferase [Synechococcus sp. RSCCF101]|uniref:histidine phosphotransferase n=1 Tax=Synechococcus sp. RSCCF101 TaxID=2511069 RepID=UPI001246FADD|nr:histidine phosphotransferase [Synechococcus sp. RSCCF101]QEY32141.1 histidine phosphotransferase [Synechococcus sp. RSCCF101]